MDDIEIELGKALSTGEVATKLSVSLKVIYGLIQRKELKARKIGGHYRIYQRWIKEYIVGKKNN